MGVATKLSPLAVSDMRELRRQGWGFDKLAARFHVGKETAERLCDGVVKPEKPKRVYKLAAMNGLTVVGATLEEARQARDRLLVAAGLEGYGLEELAAMFAMRTDDVIKAVANVAGQARKARLIG